MKYTFSNANVTYTGTYDRNELVNILNGIFKSFDQENLSLDSPLDFSSSIPLVATLRDAWEGSSASKKFEADFSSESSKHVVAKYFIKIHPTGAEAAREKDLLKILSTTNLDILQTKVVELDGAALSKVIVLRHTDGSTGKDLLSLKELLKNLIESDDLTGLNDLASVLKSQLPVLREGINKFPIKTVVIQDYLQSLEHRFLPDYVFDFSNRIVKSETIQQEFFLTVSQEDTTATQSEKDTIPQINFDALEPKIYLRRFPKKRWFRIKLTNEKLSHGYFQKFQTDNSKVVWIRFPDNVQFADKTAINLVFSPDTDVFRSMGNVLIDAGFDEQLTDFILNLKGFVKQHFEKVSTQLIHDDLHVGNLRVSTDGGFKVVDYEQWGYNLPYMMMARLEYSVWQTLSDRSNVFTTQDIRKNILAKLSIDDPAPAIAVDKYRPAKDDAILKILQAIHLGLHRTETGKELHLAYIVQGIIFIRYLLKENALSGSRIPLVLAIRYYMEHCKTQIEISQRTSIADFQEEDEPKHFIDTNAEPTILDLWKVSLFSVSDDRLTSRSQDVLNSLQKSSAKLLERNLTELQYYLWIKREEVFTSKKNVILSAPTSSGKSTIADLFLVRNFILNENRRCALYIAPTRALTQVKFRELQQRFRYSSFLQDDIILSTGEDSKDDWRINHGKFFIACMVYEKANILFSQNQRLLEKIGCVVVDEMHMIMDLERGPIIEVMLAKLIKERKDENRRETRRKEPIRIIALSTENNENESPLIKFLTTEDENDLLLKCPPIQLLATKRPVEVAHYLCLLNRAREKPMEQILIAKFASNEDRHLSLTARKELDKRISEWESNVRNSIHDVFRADQTRLLMNFLRDKLSENPRGYRILIFVPSRAEIHQYAAQLKNLLIESKSPNSIHTELISRLSSYLNNSENLRIIDLLKDCIQYGILFHHSDVDRKIRTEIEDIWSQFYPESGSQVLFTTETLSYGVNLAIHDVILFGTEFNAQNRMREPSIEPLSNHAFHNMVGRAGRLNQIKDNSNVYIFTREPRIIVRDYYTGIDYIKSQVYVKDDMAIQLHQIDKSPILPIAYKSGDNGCEHCRMLSIEEWSYPFVRTVLDVLRHLNTSISANAAQRASLEEIVDFFIASIYWQMLEGSETEKREKQLFKCAIQRILETGSESPLNLINMEEQHLADRKKWYFTISERGKAVIDTGTEITTIKPLIRIIEDFKDRWLLCFPGSKFPTELYLLCILCMEEVSRKFVYSMPECRTKKGNSNASWTSNVQQQNRENIKIRVSESLHKFMTPEQVNKFQNEIYDILEEFEPVRKNDSNNYPNSGVDAILRFFCSLIGWMNFMEFPRVESIYEGTHSNIYKGFEVPDNCKGNLQGFRQLIDLIAWKILFLTRLLEKSTLDNMGNKLALDDQRNLLLLASRIRIGCPNDAIPLFWPFSSDFKRGEARELLEHDLTPVRILKASSPEILQINESIFTEEKLNQLKEDITHFVITEFKALSAEWTFDPNSSASVRRGHINELWEDCQGIFLNSVRNYYEHSSDENLTNLLFRSLYIDTGTSEEDDEIEDTNSVDVPTLGEPRASQTIEEEFIINVYAENEVLLLDGKKYTPRNRRENPEASPNADTQGPSLDKYKIIGLQIDSNWHCLINGVWIPFLKVLEDEPFNNVLFVVTPWIPLVDTAPPEVIDIISERREENRNTKFISIGAFLIFLSVVVRDFSSGKFLFELLCDKDNPSGEINSVINITQIHQQLRDQGIVLPPAIDEATAKHFEISN